MVLTASKGHASATGEQSKTTGLLDLPAELWSKIGKLVIHDAPTFVGKVLNVISSPRSKGATYIPRSQRFQTTNYQQPPITRTCNALRYELLPYYYSTKIDITVFGELRFNNTGKWLQIIGRATYVHISGLKVDLGRKRKRYPMPGDSGQFTQGLQRYVPPGKEEWRRIDDLDAFMKEVERKWQVEIALEFESKGLADETYRITIV